MELQPLKTTHTLIALCCLALTACRATDAERVIPPDDEILRKVYDDFYQVPDYFHVDERADTPRSYVLHHVKDRTVSYELCTDDYYEALAWEEADSFSRAVTGYYVGSNENDRYFEFIRELSYPDGLGNITDPTSPGYARIFKCSYVRRDYVDRTIRDGYAGTLSMRPLSEDAIRTFSEYMWQFTYFWPARKKVLATFSNEQETAYQHTLLLAFATNQGTDECDLIEVVDWVFTVDKSDGQISKDFVPLFEFQAQLINGTPQKCTN